MSYPTKNPPINSAGIQRVRRRKSRGRPGKIPGSTRKTKEKLRKLNKVQKGPNKVKKRQRETKEIEGCPRARIDTPPPPTPRHQRISSCVRYAAPALQRATSSLPLVLLPLSLSFLLSRPSTPSSSFSSFSPSPPRCDDPTPSLPPRIPRPPPNSFFRPFPAVSDLLPPPTAGHSPARGRSKTPYAPEGRGFLYYTVSNILSH